jgi:hypothetical protein
MDPRWYHRARTAIRHKRQQIAALTAHLQTLPSDPGRTLSTRVSPAQVVLCLIDLKLARLARDPKHLDSQVDVAGYAAVLREVSR